MWRWEVRFLPTGTIPNRPDKPDEGQLARSDAASVGDTMTVFFGFALADSMFSGDRMIARKQLTAEEAVTVVQDGVTPILNPSHAATIAAMRSRYGIDVEIPEKPPMAALGVGDSVVVMGVRGLPRLTDRHEYTSEEVAQATFSFSIYTVES